MAARVLCGPPLAPEAIQDSTGSQSVGQPLLFVVPVVYQRGERMAGGMATNPTPRASASYIASDRGFVPALQSSLPESPGTDGFAGYVCSDIVCTGECVWRRTQVFDDLGRLTTVSLRANPSDTEAERVADASLCLTSCPAPLTVSFARRDPRPINKFIRLTPTTKVQRDTAASLAASFPRPGLNAGLRFGPPAAPPFVLDPSGDVPDERRTE